METKLNQLLSDLVVFYHKLQSYHWYAKGHTFFGTHAKLEEYYNEINGQIDEIAEMLLQEGKKPLSTMEAFLKTAKINEGVSDYIGSKAIYEAVLADYKYLLDSVKAIKASADEASDYLVSYKIDDFIGAYSKNIWMLSQLLMGD